MFYCWVSDGMNVFDSTQRGLRVMQMTLFL